MIKIRPAVSADQEDIWHIIQQVISAGDTCVFNPGTPREEMPAYWLAPDKHTYVATLDGNVAGTFIIKDNMHISCTAGYDHCLSQ